MKKKKVLIIGAGIKEYSLAEKFSQYENVEKVFAAPGNTLMEEFCTCVDIRADKPMELLKFAVENEIDMTIAGSKKAIKNDISGVFHINNRLIFAPPAADFVLNSGAMKKFLYKLNIPTSKFGVFDNAKNAADFLKEADYPLVAGTEDGSCKRIFTSFQPAKNFTEELFLLNEKRVVIEDYVYGHEFTFYAITDGYHALPLVSAARTDDFVYAPDYKVSVDMEHELTDIVFRILETKQRQGMPYLGILGLECTLAEDEAFVVRGVTPFLKDEDATAVLNLIDENLYTLFENCAIGSFADDYHEVMIAPMSSVSRIVEGKTVSASANTLTRACEKLSEELVQPL